MGRVLARKLVTSGHRVTIANSREPESLAAFAAEVGAAVARASDLAATCEIVFLAIPTRAVTAVPAGLFVGAGRAPIIVDVANYHPELRDGRIEAIDRGMLESQWVAQQLGCPVIKAFNNILAPSLAGKAAPPGSPGRLALSVAGDPESQRREVLRLVDELGVDPVDAGPLSESWRQQPGTPCYCKDYGAAAMKEALAQADHARIAAYRTQADDAARPYFASP